MDPVYEELLTLPSIYNICQRAIIEGRGGPGVTPHPEGPVLTHEMAQHAPGRTPGGQDWHRDGNSSVNPGLVTSPGPPASISKGGGSVGGRWMITPATLCGAKTSLVFD